ncbi:MAG: hypothetical protein QXW98_04005 [Candidatus Caldarchaeum sp.]
MSVEPEYLVHILANAVLHNAFRGRVSVGETIDCFCDEYGWSNGAEVEVFSDRVVVRVICDDGSTVSTSRRLGKDDIGIVLRAVYSDNSRATSSKRINTMNDKNKKDSGGKDTF